MDALKTLLLRSLDYAGVFPPAQLPMNDAVSEFSKCLCDRNEWLLARFVLPAARIGEFAQCSRASLAEAAATHKPWHATGLLRSAPSIDEALSILRSDLSLLRGLIQSHPDALVVDSCELPLPEEVLNTHDQEIARGFLVEARKVFEECNFHVPVFWEVNLSKSFEHFARAAHQANVVRPGEVGMKFRTGGMTAAAIVGPENLAHAFRLAQSERLPFKLTAGLHLAMRHFDSAVGADVFGFLNVFCAAVLGWTHQLSETELRLMLEEKDPGAFVFSAEGLAWKKHSASISQIRAARADGLRSFGSCSFREPMDDLQTLNLIH